MDFQRLAEAIENFKTRVAISQAFGPDSLPGAMSCGEANVFAELLDALGLTVEASDLRRWHLFSEGNPERDDWHDDWPEADEPALIEYYQSLLEQ